MNRLLKIVLYLVLIALVVIVGAITYVSTALPNIDAPKDLKVEVTPERVARGEYLANHVCACMDCHSTRDWNTFTAPPKPGTAGAGGEVFDRTMNFPGRFVSRNITPHGLGDWSDGEIYRAITSGVSRDGHPFFPVMPYPYYRTMDSEDIYSLIAYLRSLPPIDTDPEASEADFPMNIIMHTIPKPAEPMKRPDPADHEAYGAYLVNAAGCVECHTKMEKGKKVGEPYAGGFAFQFPNGAVLRSPNITPDKTTGIGAWTRETFISRFKQYSDSTYTSPAINWEAGDFQTVMPWSMYTGMTQEDLGAIYDFLRTVKPVASVVERWTPPGS
ncbi:MAG: c-type cytochrome [Flavobacteriales bacterium]|nr:c-type cytochrome [Flavobacteriales bacterium]